MAWKVGFDCLILRVQGPELECHLENLPGTQALLPFASHPWYSPWWRALCPVCISNLCPHPLTPLNHTSGSDQWHSPPLGGQIWEESIHALEAAWYLVKELRGPGA